ncbi:MAG: C4-dicarboxylate ABC transporter, partial [Clostridiaceae bacterium]|nr:C4-dicarboxylate ABC transporter [Clostridiaceae bacterium]
MKKSFNLVSLLLIAALALPGCTPKESSKVDPAPQKENEKIVWKLGHLGNEDHIWNRTALKFAELVSEKTDGQIEVKVYPSEQLGN